MTYDKPIEPRVRKNLGALAQGSAAARASEFEEDRSFNGSSNVEGPHQVRIRELQDGIREVEGTPEAVAAYFASYDQRRCSRMDSIKDGVSARASLGYTISGKPRKVWRSRYRPVRNHRKHSLEARLERSIRLLELVAIRPGEVTGQDIIKALDLDGHQSIGAVVKDADRFLVEAGLNPRNVWEVRGRSPRCYCPCKLLSEGLEKLGQRRREERQLLGASNNGQTSKEGKEDFAATRFEEIN